MRTAPTGAMQHQVMMQPGNALSADPDNQQDFIQETDMQVPMPPPFDFPGAPTGPNSTNFPMSSEFQAKCNVNRIERRLS